MTFRSSSVLALAILIASCAEGGGTAPAPENGGGALCGNGVIDDANVESCECPVGTIGTCAVTDKTCSTLDQSKTGSLLCDAAMCMYVMDMCTAASTGTSGTGGGTSGTTGGDGT